MIEVFWKVSFCEYLRGVGVGYSVGGVGGLLIIKYLIFFEKDIKY